MNRVKLSTTSRKEEIVGPRFRGGGGVIGEQIIRGTRGDSVNGYN